ncbi:hypothetical protein BGZ72_005604 [Mortierella alpina]|nr:hypothetical protein BGZ72_005604 [Mortierella alpina]
MTPPTPAQFDVINHPVKETLMIVSSLLSMLVHKNDNTYNPQRDPITLFHSRAVPRISIEAYLTRVLQYIPFTNEVLLNVLVFLDRIGGLEGMQQQPSPAPRMTPVPATSTSTSSASSPLSSPSLVSVHTVPDFCKAASSSPSSSNSAAAAAAVSTTASVANVPSVIPSSCISDSSPPTIQKRGREQESGDGPLVMDQQKRQRTTATVSAQSDGTVTPPSVPHLPATTPVHSAGNGFRVNSFNIHRLLITCLMVAAKFTSDLFYSNARYAKVGGLSLPELNQLELEFLFTTKFELNVKVDELQRVGNALLMFRDRQMVPVLLQEQLRRQQQHDLLVQLHFQQQQQQQQHQGCQQVSLHQQQQQQQHHHHTSPPQKQGVTYAIPSPITPTGSFSVQAGPNQPQSSQTHLLSPPEEKNRLRESEIHDVV